MIVRCKIAVCMFIKNPFPCFDDFTLRCGEWRTGVFWFVALIKDIKCIFRNPFIPFTAEIVSSHHQLFMVAKVQAVCTAKMPLMKNSSLYFHVCDFLSSNPRIFSSLHLLHEWRATTGTPITNTQSWELTEHGIIIKMHFVYAIDCFTGRCELIMDSWFQHNIQINDNERVCSEFFLYSVLFLFLYLGQFFYTLIRFIDNYKSKNDFFSASPIKTRKILN